MRKLIILALLSGFILAACTSQSTTEAVPASEEELAAETVDTTSEESVVAPSSDGIVHWASGPADPAEFRADNAEVIGSTGRPQVIEFFAYWCSNCNAARPRVQAMEAAYWGKVDFVYLDIDDPANADVKSQYGYVAQPYFVILDADGNAIDQWFGFGGEEDFYNAFEKVE